MEKRTALAFALAARMRSAMRVSALGRKGRQGIRVLESYCVSPKGEEKAIPIKIIDRQDSPMSPHYWEFPIRKLVDFPKDSARLMSAAD